MIDIRTKYEVGPIRIRPLREDDLPFTLAWRNRDDVRVWFKHKEVLTPDQHANWFLKYTKNNYDFMFIVEETQHSDRVGQVGIYNIDLEKNSAEIGRFIAAPEHRGKGYMRYAIEALSSFAFDFLPGCRLWLEVYTTNTRARRLYEECGFTYTITNGDIIVMERYDRKSQ